MLQTLRSLLSRWWPAVLIMTIIFFASATPGDELPQFGALDFSFKTGGHAFGYALLALSYLRGLAAGRQPSWRKMVLAVLFSFLYATTDEFHQIFTPGRTPSPVDVMIDTTGATLGVATWAFVRHHFFSRRTTP